MQASDCEGGHACLFNMLATGRASYEDEEKRQACQLFFEGLIQPLGTLSAHHLLHQEA